MNSQLFHVTIFPLALRIQNFKPRTQNYHPIRRFLGGTVQLHSWLMKQIAKPGQFRIEFKFRSLFQELSNQTSDKIGSLSPLYTLQKPIIIIKNNTYCDNDIN